VTDRDRSNEMRNFNIPYLWIETRKAVEKDEIGMTFKSDRQWRYFCWCLQENWEAFDQETMRRWMELSRDLCKEGTKLRVPAAWRAAKKVKRRDA